MELEMESMASAIGVSVPVLRFLPCIVATIPVSFLYRFLPGPIGKHVYALATGAYLSYLSFGVSSNLRCLVVMLISYVSMLFFRSQCRILTFSLGFWLSHWMPCVLHDWRGMEARRNGCHWALMVLTLNVISCSINYNDGLLEEDDLRETQKKNRLIKMPSFIEYSSYCLCCGNHFAGPVYEMKDYLEWTERKGVWSQTETRPSPSPYGATLRALFQAAICMAMYLYLVPKVSLVTVQ